MGERADNEARQRKLRTSPGLILIGILSLNKKTCNNVATSIFFLK
jgi:hypothetical protein